MFIEYWERFALCQEVETMHPNLDSTSAKLEDGLFALI